MEKSSPIAGFFRKIIYAGIKPDLTVHRRRKVVLLNSMCLTGIVVYIMLFIINVFKSTNYSFVYTNLLAQSVFTATIYLNYKGKFRIAAFFCSTVFLVYINILAVLYGKQSGLEYINILLCASPVVFFDSRFAIFLFSSLSVACFFTCRYLYTIIPPALSHGNLEVLSYITMGFLFLCLFLMFLFFKNEIIAYSMLVDSQRQILAERNKEISDSIYYAGGIQRALLQFENDVLDLFPDSFILFKPKDVVSGDFYWMLKKDRKVFGAAVDCTGHGVPGAMMSMMGHTLLNEMVSSKGIEAPDEVLNELRKSIISSFGQEKTSGARKDGMDVALCVFDTEQMLLQFAGANNPLYLVRDKVLTEYKADRQPVGHNYGNETPFSLHTIPVKKGDIIYIFTDGYADQFGGPESKKFKSKNFKDLLLAISPLPMQQQHQELLRSFSEWQGRLEQTDDVLVIGVRIS